VVPTKVPAPATSLNAFTFLVSRIIEDEAWKEATEAESSKLTSNGKNKGKGTRKNGKRMRNQGRATDDEIE